MGRLAFGGRDGKGPDPCSIDDQEDQVEPDSRSHDNKDQRQTILQGELGMEHAVVRECCSGRSIRKPDWDLGSLRRR